MRFFTSSLAIVSIAFALAGCSGKSDSNADQSNASSTAAAQASDAGSQASAAPAQAGGTIPDYPGAATTASTAAAGAMMSHASGRVLTTSDSFDKVYAWYQKNMPAGSERLHITQPAQNAVFVITSPGKGQDSVNIATRAGKTIVTIAHVISGSAQ